MREWIVTNGLGGYTSFTTRQTANRKFHGLLIASLHPPVERWMFVHNMLDSIVTDNGSFYLYDMKPTFSFDYLPTVTYRFDGGMLRKTFCMPHDHNSSIIKYDVRSKKPVTLIHEPLVTSRHFYDVYPTIPSVDFKIQTTKEGLVVKPSNIQYPLHIKIPGSIFEENMYWLPIYYPVDSQRNDSCHDHLFHVGRCIKPLRGPTTYYVSCTIEKDTSFSSDVLFQQEILRKKKILEQSDLPSQFHRLVLSTDNFLVKKGKHSTVIAGYHWFSDWGRDTLIALPGLTLVTKRYQIAKDILLELHQTCKQGIIPNTFDDRNATPAYNTVDASLWFIDRVYQYMKYTNDTDFLKKIYPTIRSIIQHYQQGTMFGIHMDEDYLIAHHPGLTWMDVKLGEFYPTPRGEKAVEIQALWYNALSILNVFSDMLGESNSYAKLADDVKTSFRQIYDKQYDVIGTKDISVRPNKIFLVSLPFTMVDKNVQTAIVEEIQHTLLTVFGLRTLAPSDPQYKGIYLGNYHRDLAYHNGTVWPWLLGPFITAFMKTHTHETRWKEYAFQEFIEPLLHVYGDIWDGSIHEIFDGDFPYSPQGCMTQAWSVAEILRAWVEDIEQRRPPFEEVFSLNEICV